MSLISWFNSLLAFVSKQLFQIFFVCIELSQQNFGGTITGSRFCFCRPCCFGSSSSFSSGSLKYVFNMRVPVSCKFYFIASAQSTKLLMTYVTIIRTTLTSQSIVYSSLFQRNWYLYIHRSINN